MRMQPGCCTAGCCAGWYHVTDPQGQKMYSLRVSDCNTHSGTCSNCCAPTCCNESYDIDVYDGEGKYVNTSAFVWPGCNCGGLTDMSNMALVFPPSSSAEQRASIVRQPRSPAPSPTNPYTAARAVCPTAPAHRDLAVGRFHAHRVHRAGTEAQQRWWRRRRRRRAARGSCSHGALNQRSRKARGSSCGPQTPSSWAKTERQDSPHAGALPRNVMNAGSCSGFVSDASSHNQCPGTQWPCTLLIAAHIPAAAVTSGIPVAAPASV